MPPVVPVFDPKLLPAFVPEKPAVRCPELAPMFREPSRSLSTVGSSLLTRFELCGPALVLPEVPVTPEPVPVNPPVVPCVVVPAVLELSRSESILGSAAFATRFEWGPAVPSGTPLLLLWWVVEVVEWSLSRWRACLTLSMVDMLIDFV